MGIFENVMIGGSDYKVVKRFGRAKDIPFNELKGFDLKYTRKCVLTESDLAFFQDLVKRGKEIIFRSLTHLKLWLKDKSQGECADLSYTDLSYFDAR